MLEHYFVSAWVPEASLNTEYQTEVLADNTYGIRFVSAPITVNPGETEQVGARLFVGPKLREELKALSQGLDLTVDYGVLWWICLPLFALLKAVFSFVGNWGLAIIITTVLIKLLFYKLSARSYSSMGNMRKIQPKIEALKERFGADKQKFGQAVMELYRKEKVNPLGGCLPIIVQIPVFISLYYVLLESVDLRQALFGLWLHDLSAKDPFYILPLIMGLSMFVQQKMNPPPPDPMQAKMLMIMPAFFTLLFLQFPSGLMLYWVVNNLLSILQQWYITKNVIKQ
jgi:YidC/Oxa1 family membrane protein insertase